MVETNACVHVGSVPDLDGPATTGGVGAGHRAPRARRGPHVPRIPSPTLPHRGTHAAWGALSCADAPTRAATGTRHSRGGLHQPEYPPGLLRGAPPPRRLARQPAARGRDPRRVPHRWPRRASGPVSPASRARPGNGRPGSSPPRFADGGQARPFGAADLAAVLATGHRPRRRGRGFESEEVALDRGRLDAVIAGARGCLHPDPPQARSPTVKQHLAADPHARRLARRQPGSPANPAAAVRGRSTSSPRVRLRRRRGSSSPRSTRTLAGLRDRTLLSVMLYSLAPREGREAARRAGPPPGGRGPRRSTSEAGGLEEPKAALFSEHGPVRAAPDGSGRSRGGSCSR